jgi:hypothetical protein
MIVGRQRAQLVQILGDEVVVRYDADMEGRTRLGDFEIRPCRRGADRGPAIRRADRGSAE